MRFALTLVALSLAACAPSVPPGGALSASCRDDDLASFTGQTASQDLGARLLAASGAKILRWVPKGGVITMDYSGDRLTVQLDSANRVETARCG